MATLQPGRMRDQAYQQQELAKLPEGERAVVGRFFAVAFGGRAPVREVRGGAVLDPRVPGGAAVRRSPPR